MSLNLPKPAAAYDAGNEAQTRAAIEKADKSNRKADQDVELGLKQQLILTDTATGARYGVTVSGGALVVTAL